ncbi:MAG: J domain-containing protein [Myxococcaceae bacterium]
MGVVPGVDPVRLELSPEECSVLACVGRACQVAEAIERTGLESSKAVSVLVDLKTKGAIQSVATPPPVAPRSSVSRASSSSAGASSSGKVADAASLEDVELPADRKAEILALESKLDTLNHFALLGVPVGASAEDARKAYYELSRRFHPDRFYGKNLGSFRTRIDRIFRKLTEAYNTLTTPAARRTYEDANPELKPAAKASAPSSTPRPRSAEDDARDAERRARFARHPYLAKANRSNELIGRAKAALAKGDPAKAYTDLHMASQMDPRNSEVTKLLDEAKRKNDASRSDVELKKAEQAEQDGDIAAAATGYRVAAGMDARNARAAYKAAQLMVRVSSDPRDTKPLAQRAVEVDPTNADYKVLLGKILLQVDMKAQAKRQFEEAIKLAPNHEEAKKHLKKMRWPF